MSGLTFTSHALCMRRSLWPLVMAAACMFPSACSRKEQPSGTSEDILVTVGDSALRMSDVLLRIPPGLDPADSAALFSRIVNHWVDDRLLESLAIDNIDNMDRIDRLVADYRRKLIVQAYRRKVRQSASTQIDEGEVKKYFDSHQEDLILETPIVKGLYIKLPESSKRLPDVRKWAASARPEDIDAIEKSGLDDAVQYDYFGDRWVDFGSLMELIPYRFYDPDAFLSSSPDFETSYDGFVYILHVSSFIPAGQPMPYEYARAIIEERLGSDRIASYEQKLLDDIRRDARKKGVLTAPGYDIDNDKLTLSPASSAKGQDRKPEGGAR